jgi:hypothetical protein
MIYSFKYQWRHAQSWGIYLPAGYVERPAASGIWLPCRVRRPRLTSLPTPGFRYYDARFGRDGMGRLYVHQAGLRDEGEYSEVAEGPMRGAVARQGQVMQLVGPLHDFDIVVIACRQHGHRSQVTEADIERQVAQLRQPCTTE